MVNSVARLGIEKGKAAAQARQRSKIEQLPLRQGRVAPDDVARLFERS